MNLDQGSKSHFGSVMMLSFFTFTAITITDKGFFIIFCWRYTKSNRGIFIKCTPFKRLQEWHAHWERSIKQNVQRNEIPNETKSHSLRFRSSSLWVVTLTAFGKHVIRTGASWRKFQKIYGIRKSNLDDPLMLDNYNRSSQKK